MEAPEKQIEALKLEEGGTYAIECQYTMTPSRTEAIRAVLDREGKRLNMKFVLLGPGFKIARAGAEVVKQP